MAGKFYAVKVGKKPGIYMTWDKCKEMVHGYPGAVYKSFPTKAEAEQFIGGDAGSARGRNLSNANSNSAGSLAGAKKAGSVGEPEDSDTYAFVDGSFNSATGVYGYGGFLVHNGEKYKVQGSGNDAEMASMRNVAGEVLGSMAAIKMAVEMGLPALDIYYDYMGIEMWAIGAWKRNKAGTIAYYEYIQTVKDKIRLRFVKVKGHSGVEGKEEADRLAKEAVGIMTP